MLNTHMDNKTILVTGATSGVGECMAGKFAEMGAKIVAIGRNQEKLQQLWHRYPKQIFPLEYDFNHLENIESIFSFCKANNLMLDGLVHCAGIAYNSAIRTSSIDEMEHTMKVNCYAFLELGKFFSMKKFSNTNSSIVAISSIVSLNHEKGLCQYAASKAAINSMVKTMSKEFIRRNIRVNAILPGNVKTPMFMAGAEQITGYMENAEKKQPLGFIDPEQIVYMAEFLLSDNAKYMTGELIVISGGMEY